MTNQYNEENAALKSNGDRPARWVVRHRSTIVSHHRTSKEAVQWLGRHYPAVEMKDLIEQGIQVTQSFMAEVRYWDRRVYPPNPFPVEFQAERGTFTGAIDELQRWLHRSWEQDRDNHPSPAGRQQVWERWHDVVALAQVASLTLLPNPTFKYAFGPLSPPEGKGHDLRIVVAPTPVAVLDAMVAHHVGS